MSTTAALTPYYPSTTTASATDTSHTLPILPDGFEIRGRGQPTKLTPELQEDIISRIEGGTPIEVACALSGITSDTFGNWVRTGRRDPNSVYAAFFSAVKSARQRLEDRLSHKWRKVVTEPVAKRKTVYKEVPIILPDGSNALDDQGNPKLLRYVDSETVEYTGDGDWRGIAEFLARRYKSRWAKSEGIELTGANGGPVDLRDATVPLEMLPVDLRRQILVALEGLQHNTEHGQGSAGVIDITPQLTGMSESESVSAGAGIRRVAGMPSEGMSERVCGGWVEMEDAVDDW